MISRTKILHLLRWGTIRKETHHCSILNGHTQLLSKKEKWHSTSSIPKSWITIQLLQTSKEHKWQQKSLIYKTTQDCLHWLKRQLALEKRYLHCLQYVCSIQSAYRKIHIRVQTFILFSWLFSTLLLWAENTSPLIM